MIKEKKFSYRNFWLALSICSLLMAGCQKKEVQLEELFDWQTFMANHDLIWEELPARWENAPFNGNGLVGSMLHVSPDSASLKLLLCRSDIGKLDYPGHFKKGNRIQLGSIDLTTEGKILFDQSEMRLNLWDAEITAQIKTTKGAFKLQAFVVLDEPVLLVKTFDFEGEETGSKWKPNFNNKGRFFKEKNLKFFEVEDKVQHERSDIKSGGHLIAWEETAIDNQRLLKVSVNSSPSTHGIWNKAKRGKLSAKEDALLAFANLEGIGADVLFQKQADWWHHFYPKSFISFGNKEIESYYWIQLYKMASSSREGMPMIDNHGVWSVEPVYGFATWDLNVQIIYRLHLATNHLDLGKPFIQFLAENYNPETMYVDSLGELRAGLRQQTFLKYKYFDPIYWEHDTKSPCDGPAKFLWGCHNYWLHFQYSQNSTLLPRLRDMLEGGVNAMKSGMELEEGKWMIPYGHSWETWRGKNPNAHIAVLNWALETLIQVETDTEKLKKWESFISEITDYEIGEKGYLLGKSKPVKPHRHWSHLLHLFPLRTTTREENEELYDRSLDAWADISTGLNSGVAKAGYAPSGAISMYAQNNESAPRIDSLINLYLYGKSSRGPNVWANTMYREFGPVIETPLFFASALNELFLQSKEKALTVFPIDSEILGDVTFHNFRTEGGYLVSGKRQKGKTVFVRLSNLNGTSLNLKVEVENLKVSGNQGAINGIGKGDYKINLDKGESILIYNSEMLDQITIEPVEPQFGNSNTFGLNEAFYEKREYLKEFRFTGR